MNGDFSINPSRKSELKVNSKTYFYKTPPLKNDEFIRSTDKSEKKETFKDKIMNLFSGAPKKDQIIEQTSSMITFKEEDLENISKLSPVLLKRLPEIISNLADVDSSTPLLDVLQLDDEKYHKALILLNKSRNLDCANIVARCDDKKFNQILYLFEKGISDKFASDLANMDDEQILRVSKLLNTYDEKFSISIAKLSKEGFKRFNDMIYQGVTDAYAFEVAQMNQESYDKFLFLISKNMPDFDAYQLLLVNDEKQYQKCLELLDNETDPFCVLKISNLSDEERKKYDYMIEKGVDCYTASLVARYEGKQFDRFFELYNMGLDSVASQECSILNDEKFERFVELYKSGLKASDAQQIANLSISDFERYNKLLKYGLVPSVAYNCVSYKGKNFDKYVYLAMRGLPNFCIRQMITSGNDEYNKTLKLLECGINPQIALKSAKSDEAYNNMVDEIYSQDNEMRDFLESGDYNLKISNATAGKYGNELYSILNKDFMPFDIRKELLESGLKENDFIDSLRKLSKSTFKFAMNTPNQYLSGIDTKYTTKIDGKYPKLTDEELLNQQRQIMTFFRAHSHELIKALKYIDTDTLNQMMDKRCDLFAVSLKNLYELKEDNLNLLSELIKGVSVKTGKPLTAKEKIQLCHIVEIYQKTGMDTTELSNMAHSGIIDLKSAKMNIQREIIKSSGIADKQISQIPPEKLNFNEEYSYLTLKNFAYGVVDRNEILRRIKRIREMTPFELENLFYATQIALNDIAYGESVSKAYPDRLDKMLDIYKNPSRYSDEEMYDIIFETEQAKMNVRSKNTRLYTVIKEAVLGDFNSFIRDTDNIYGKINHKTMEEFQKNGLDYNQWLNPDIEDIEFEIQGKKLKIKFWERNPKEDLFIGNKTTCCSAIGTGKNEGATPIYLLNTAFNVAQLVDENDRVVGMSRVFMAKINDKPSLVMDNIELNKTFIKGMKNSELGKIRDSFFEYMNNYIDKVTNKPDSRVYFCSEDSNVPTRDLNVKNFAADFIGKISDNSVYVNSYNCRWINPSEMKDYGKNSWYIVPKN